ncbi:MAG: DUF559 domain-containing protein [Solirubrobacterales bacterium]|nr:DUF559 domain-containing protein [Solirubrobacterales bacterium]
MAEKSANPDRRVSLLAARQHGVVSIAQLREVGLSDDAVLGRVRAGRLHRLHQGVYAVGHRAVSIEGRWMAAVLACGEGAALSHRSAACLWRMLDPRDGPIDVSVPTASGRKRRRGILLRRRAALSPLVVTERQRIPVTTPAQTIADLGIGIGAGTAPRPGAISVAELRRAIRQAEVRGLPTGLEAGEPTRSELEHLFLQLCRRHRLAMPEVNVRVGAHEVDFLWRPQRLIVETDGYRYHRGAAAFESDRRRDFDLQSQGYAVHRLTYRQVTEEPHRVGNAIAAAISFS